jgi:dissimilatory sulfite reductase (desulfoviridin) alpha/beta subunit
MRWSSEAEAELKKVPFFVRKRVRARVETEAAQAGKAVVALADLHAAKARFLAGMAAEVKGYRIDSCFGPSGCPNRAAPSDGLIARIEALVQAQDLLGFLRARVPGELKFHHEFRIGVADCPNACSQPQIRDVAIIGACLPAVNARDCSGCGACVEACPEQAMALDPRQGLPRIDGVGCLKCGQCVAVCPSGTLVEGQRGFRVQLGGRLGRHPRLARELPGIHSADQVLEILQACLALYKQRCGKGERFAHLLQDDDFEAIARRFNPPGI